MKLQPNRLSPKLLTRSDNAQVVRIAPNSADIREETSGLPQTLACLIPSAMTVCALLSKQTFVRSPNLPARNGGRYDRECTRRHAACARGPCLSCSDSFRETAGGHPATSARAQGCLLLASQPQAQSAARAPDRASDHGCCSHPPSRFEAEAAQGAQVSPFSSTEFQSVEAIGGVIVASSERTPSQANNRCPGQLR